LKKHIDLEIKTLNEKTVSFVDHKVVNLEQNEIVPINANHEVLKDQF